MEMRNTAYAIALIFVFSLFFLSESQGTTGNPYFFGLSSYQTGFNDREGLERALPQFTSPELQAISKYLIAYMESSPRTFALARHPDADVVFYIVKGRGVIGYVDEEGKTNVKLERGDVGRVPAGTTHFVVNTDENERLILAIIFLPLNASFKKFFPAASINQTSYFNGFSSGVLRTSLNISSDLVAVLQQGTQPLGKVIRAVTPQEVLELTQGAGSGRLGTVFSAYHLLRQTPIFSNMFGQFYEAKPERVIQLRDLGISVSYVNMTPGTIFVPHYSTVAITAFFVEKGCARFEMATPEAVASLVCEDEVFIAPAGYPLAIISRAQNFAAVGFGVNANGNIRTFVAGQGNVLSKLDTAVNRISYGVSNNVAAKLFTSQRYSYFVPTKQGREQNLSPESAFDYVG